MSNKLYVAGWACDLDRQGNIWISHFGINGFFRYDIEKDELRYIGRFDEVPINKMLIHGNLYCVDDKVFFSNIIDGKGYIYDIKNTGMLNIDFPRENGNQTDVLFRSGGNAYARLSDNSVYKIDSETLDIVYCEKITEIVRDFAKLLDVDYLKGSVYTGGNYGVYCYNNDIWCVYRDKLRAIDMDTCDFRDFTLPDKAVFQLFFNGNKLWYTHHFDCDIVCYDLVSEKSVKYRGDTVKYRENIKESDRVRPYSCIFFCDGNVVIPGFRAEGFYRIDKEDGTVKEWDVVEDKPELNDWNENDLNPHYYRLFRYKDEIVFVPNTSKVLIRYNMKTGYVSYRDFSITMSSDDKWDRFFIEAYKGGVVNESENIYSLDNYLKVIKVM